MKSLYSHIFVVVKLGSAPLTVIELTKVLK